MQLEHALTISERLLDQAEWTSERRRTVRTTEAGIVAFALLVITGVAGLDQAAGGTRLTIVAVIVFLLGISVATMIYLVLEIPLRERAARDARVLVETVGLIRELLPLVARSEEWDELQTDLFRSRLSRFPIGPGDIK
jgi:hypothetical protein